MPVGSEAYEVLAVRYGTRQTSAADAVHYYEELERDRPFTTVVNLADMYAAFDRIREMEQDTGTSTVQWVTSASSRGRSRNS